MISKFLYVIFFSTFASSISVYNYYELAVQKWCSSDYMIHGLWPQINSTSYPSDCMDVTYTTPTGILLENMNTYWHACDDSLWKHEWEKHGSCMQEQINIDESTFFNITMNLFLENASLLDSCKDDDCIMACFDLEYNVIQCE